MKFIRDVVCGFWKLYIIGEVTENSTIIKLSFSDIACLNLLIDSLIRSYNIEKMVKTKEYVDVYVINRPILRIIRKEISTLKYINYVPHCDHSAYIAGFGTRKEFGYSLTKFTETCLVDCTIESSLYIDCLKEFRNQGGKLFVHKSDQHLLPRLIQRLNSSIYEGVNIEVISGDKIQIEKVDDWIPRKMFWNFRISPLIHFVDWCKVNNINQDIVLCIISKYMN